jgi:hypothetical protein
LENNDLEAEEMKFSCVELHNKRNHFEVDESEIDYVKYEVYNGRSKERILHLKSGMKCKLTISKEDIEQEGLFEAKKAYLDKLVRS